MDPFEQLRLLEKKKDKLLYVYYNSRNGEIIHVRNVVTKDIYPYIAVKNIENIDIVKYKVDVNNTTPVLVKISDILDKFNTKVDSIDRFEKRIINKKVTQRDYKFDLLIEQDDKEQQFRIRLSSNLKKSFSKLQEFDKKITVYVTEENDPNILHQTLKFNISDLVRNHYYTIAYENFDGGECSVYGYENFSVNMHIEVKR